MTAVQKRKKMCEEVENSINRLSVRYGPEVLDVFEQVALMLKSSREREKAEERRKMFGRDYASG